MTVLKINIKCGKTMCASQPGEFCEYLGSRRYGTTPVCMLFPQADPNPHNVGGTTDLQDVDGWVRRCQMCLDSDPQT
jgi:hypothetical protein